MYIACLRLASSVCWVPAYNNKESKTREEKYKLPSERAVYEIESAVKGLLLAVQTKMGLTFPTQFVKNISRVEIEKELIDIKEDTIGLRKSLKKKCFIFCLCVFF